MERGAAVQKVHQDICDLLNDYLRSIKHTNPAEVQSDHVIIFYLREIMGKFLKIHEQLPYEEFINIYIATIIRILLLVLQTSVCFTDSNFLLVKEILESFNVKLQYDIANTDEEILALRISIGEISSLAYDVSVFQETNYEGLSILSSLRLICCIYKPTMKTRILPSYMNFYQTVERAFETLEGSDALMRKMVAAFLSSKSFTYEDCIKFSDEGLHCIAMHRLKWQNTPIKLTFIKDVPLTEKTLVSLSNIGFSEDQAKSHTNIPYSVRCLTSETDTELSSSELTSGLANLLKSYEECENSFDNNDLNSVMPYHLFRNISGTICTQQSKILPSNKYRVKRSIENDEMKKLFKIIAREKLKESRAQNEVSIEEEPLLLEKVPEDSIPDILPLPEVDFSMKDFPIPSRSFETVLKVWLFLNSFPKQFKLSRMDLNLFAQAIAEPSETSIVSESIKSFLHQLGHKLSSQSDRYGFFRVTVRRSIIGEAITFLKKRLSAKSTSQDIKGASCAVCKETSGNINLACCLCQKTFHSKCLEMRAIPEAAWKCASCILQMRPFSDAQNIDIGSEDTRVKSISDEDALQSICAKVQNLSRAMSIFGQEIQWSRLSLQERVDLYDLLYTLALRQSSFHDYIFDAVFKTNDFYFPISSSKSKRMSSKVDEVAQNYEQEAMVSLRPLGMDRYHRLYWRVPTDGRIFVQSLENSLAWDRSKQRKTDQPVQRPSIVLDEESSGSGNEADSPGLEKHIGWGLIDQKNVPMLVEALAPQGIYESNLLLNIQGLPKAETDVPEAADEEPTYRITRNRALSPLQRYENTLA